MHITNLKILDILSGVRSHTIEEQNKDHTIRGLSNNSKLIRQGEAFIAISGTTSDGHSYIQDALKQGASIIIIDNDQYIGNYPFILVENARTALSELSAYYYETPSKSLDVIGITGTNGKTTTNWMIYHLLHMLGKAVLRIGTLGNEGLLAQGEKVLSQQDTLTTGDSLFLQKIMHEALTHGIESVVMEVSSHALDQARVNSIEFDVAVFTNLTQDHLDYHKTFEHYFNAKAKLFSILHNSSKEKKTAIVNINGTYGKRIASQCASFSFPVISVGDTAESTIQIVSVHSSIQENIITLKIEGKSFSIKTNFIGHHNAENVACAIATAWALGFNLEDIMNYVPLIPHVPGRLEACGNDTLGIYVDYAHTPDALKNVLMAIRPIVTKKLLVLFGCGGDRDRTKRPIMAEIARKIADTVIVTSDNPRTEDPLDIIKDILSKGAHADIIEVDRRIAIKKAIACMEKGDILIIAGKGHEDYQIIGTKKEYFSDQEEIKRVLRELNN